MKKYLVVITIAICFIVSKTDIAIAHPFDNLLLTKIKDDPGSAIPTKAGRIKKGRDLFFNETFGGNGRTCGTCHLETKAFTISPADIAALPPNNPLFVNETNPSLAGLEDSALLRGFGLVCENLDGFDKQCVFRGPPHTLALGTSTRPDPGVNENALGWSGDGSPGALRFFAVGAVVQHFPLTLNRVLDVDFRLPTKQDLDDMEEFQLSLGRSADVKLADLVFADPAVESGKALFISAPSRGGTRGCGGCHGEAGSNNAAGINRNFNTGVSRNPFAPICRGAAPGDGGLKTTPVTQATVACADGSIRPVTFLGNETFNVPPLIEAADTGPFFHDNSAATLEAAITFYTSETFNASPAGNNNAFVLAADDINDISAFLRTLNARQNVITGMALDNNGAINSLGQPDALIARALSETLSAINVLTGSPVPIYQNTSIVSLLQQAAVAEQKALASPAARPVNLTQAAAFKRQALGQFTE